jgi:UDP-glucose 4-epimerase
MAKVAQPGDQIVMLDNLCNSKVATVDQIRQIVLEDIDRSVSSRLEEGYVSDLNMVTNKTETISLIDSPVEAITFIQGEIRDTASLKQVLSEHNIDGVIHFADLKAIGQSASCQTHE